MTQNPRRVMLRPEQNPRIRPNSCKCYNCDTKKALKLQVDFTSNNVQVRMQSARSIVDGGALIVKLNFRMEPGESCFRLFDE